MIIYNNIEDFLTLKPRHYGFLKEICLTRSISDKKSSKYNLELILSKISGGVTEDLRIQCLNVFNINIGCIEGMFGLMINIEDISDRQIEGAVYSIVDEEEGALSFYCEEFLVELN